VLPRLTVYGRVDAARKLWPHLQELELADPKFLAHDLIDLLLGADVHATILQEGLRKANPRSPIAQRTSLGWIISGLTGETGEKQISAHQYRYVRAFTAHDRASGPLQHLPLSTPFVARNGTQVRDRRVLPRPVR